MIDEIIPGRRPGLIELTCDGSSGRSELNVVTSSTEVEFAVRIHLLRKFRQIEGTHNLYSRGANFFQSFKKRYLFCRFQSRPSYLSRTHLSNGIEIRMKLDRTERMKRDTVVTSARIRILLFFFYSKCLTNAFTVFTVLVLSSISTAAIR